MLAPQIGIAPGITSDSSRRNDLRLSCLLAQALMSLGSIANLSEATIYSCLIALHFLLLVG